MKKYKQTEIPEVSIPKDWEDKTSAELREIAFKKLKELAGKIVVNEHLNIPIEISVAGIKKTTRGGAMYSKKAVLSFCLVELLRYAKYNNWGDRKEKDAATVIGYLNFNAECIIDKNREKIHLVVQFQKNGTFHYSVEVNKKSELPKTRRLALCRTPI